MRARCAFCDLYEPCREGEAPPHNESEECFVARRLVDLASVRAHFVALREACRLPAEPWGTMERTLVDHLSNAMRERSGLLEFSFRADGGAFSPYRFSYSFPNWGASSGRDAPTLGALFQPFGPGLLAQAQRLIGTAAPEHTPQILVGVDASRPAAPFKLYWQFEPGGEAAKVRLLRRLLPAAALHAMPARTSDLHLVGADFDEAGVARVKLYFLQPFVRAAALKSRFPRARSLLALLEGPLREGVHDLLLVRRFRKGQGEGPVVAQIDFGLVPNELGFEDLERLHAGRGAAASFVSVRRLAAGRRLAASRVSFSTDGEGKLNLYYLLMDPARHNGG